MAKIVGTGKYTYEMNEDWAHLPEGMEMPAASVYGDSQDRIYCFNRAPEHPIVVFDKDGNYLDSWGSGLFTFPHAIYLDADQNVWLVERNDHLIMKFTRTGEHIMTIGTKGQRSDTGFDPSYLGSDAHKLVTHGGGPFNMPAGVAVAPSGDVFIADGYGNCQVHKFTADGQLVMSWGDPGSGPGQFMLPHGVWIDSRGRVLVADRENDRVQVFTQEGEFIGVWPTPMVGPAVLYVDNKDTVYVAEHNGGNISILNLDGELLARWGSPNYRSCHGVWVDSHGDLYVVQPGEDAAGVGGRKVVKYTRK
jgi:DNA-binding beta-propeller fold protein YncE